MKEYQSIRNNPYLLPHSLYMRILYIIRDYDRLKEKAEALCGFGKATLPRSFAKTPDDIDSVKGIKEQPDDSADRCAELALLEVDAIESALLLIPDFYREGVLKNIMTGSRYPLGADERTFRRYKQRYIYHVARLLNFVL